jgi:Protein of unknown function (DUF2946)
MDDIVKAALKKWPNVPDCYGWLALDARGDWYMRDDRIQAAGPFPKIKGSRIEHDKLREFIERNYLCDARGQWFFQNGPQRVYVELEAAPWVWRLTPVEGGAPSVTSHTGLAAQMQSAWLDEAGRLFLATDLGLGLVHTLDTGWAADAVEAALWTPVAAHFEQLGRQFGHVLRPQELPLETIKPVG